MKEVLVSKHLEAISKGSLSPFNSELAENATSITIEYMGKFLEECCPSVKIAGKSFIHAEHQYDRNIWINDAKIYTTSQLVELFLKNDCPSDSTAI